MQATANLQFFPRKLGGRGILGLKWPVERRNEKLGRTGKFTRKSRAGSLLGTSKSSDEGPGQLWGMSMVMVLLPETTQVSSLHSLCIALAWLT